MTEIKVTTVCGDEHFITVSYGQEIASVEVVKKKPIWVHTNEYDNQAFMTDKAIQRGFYLVDDDTYIRLKDSDDENVFCMYKKGMNLKGVR